jgi:hypothetical protein
MSIMDKREIKSDGLAFKLLEEMLYISYVVIGYYLSFMLRYRMNPDIFNLQPFYDSIPYITEFVKIVVTIPLNSLKL